MATVAASGPHRLRSWAVALVLFLSTLVGGLQPTSMVCPGSQTVCADVAVTVAVNPDHTPTAQLLDYRVAAGHSHGPPATINGPATNGHTYYVMAGNTPVLVHNTGPCGTSLDDAISRGARTTSNFDDVARRLAQNHGIDPNVASDRLHAIKQANGLGGADNVVFDLTGNVWDPRTGDYLGSLTQGGAGSYVP